jgi:hypothetical protein
MTKPVELSELKQTSQGTNLVAITAIKSTSRETQIVGGLSVDALTCVRYAMAPEFFTKHTLARVAGVDRRSKAIASLKPVASLVKSAGKRTPLYSLNQLFNVRDSRR